jgi:hypothetical protein
MSLSTSSGRYAHLSDPSEEGHVEALSLFWTRLEASFQDPEQLGFLHVLVKLIDSVSGPFYRSANLTDCYSFPGSQPFGPGERPRRSLGVGLNPGLQAYLNVRVNRAMELFKTGSIEEPLKK